MNINAKVLNKVQNPANVIKAYIPLLLPNSTINWHFGSIILYFLFYILVIILNCGISMDIPYISHLWAFPDNASSTLTSISHLTRSFLSSKNHLISFSFWPELFLMIYQIVQSVLMDVFPTKNQMVTDYVVFIF